MGGIVITYGALSPLSLPGIQMYYYAGLDGKPYFNNVNGNGGLINQWIDNSGGAHNANASGAARPTYSTNVQNGLGAVTFDGVAQFMDVNPIAFLQNISGYTIFLVARSLNITGSKTLITFGNTNPTATDFDLTYNGTNYAVSQGGAIGTSTIAGDTTTFHLFTIVYDGTQTGNANRLKFRFDRVAQTLSYTGTVPATTTAILSDFFLAASVGNKKGTPSWNGYMGELILINQTLSQSLIDSMEYSLKNLWNTP